MMSQNDFQPDWLSVPGGTILDVLEEQGLSSKDFAGLLGYSLERAERLIAGKDAITKDVARHLSQRIGGSEKFWLARERNYRNEIARLQRAGNSGAARAWLDELPLKDMQELGLISPASSVEERLRRCLEYFDVKDVGEWRRRFEPVLSAVTFRTSPTYKSEPAAVLTWLRFGEIKAAKIQCRSWNAAAFHKSLTEMRRLTRKKEPAVFITEMREICAQSGVALVVARPPSGCRASGATRFLSSKRALILMSFRYLSDDHFWFTFFHEAAHLILHGDRSLFIEDGSEVTRKEEEEAISSLFGSAERADLSEPEQPQSAPYSILLLLSRAHRSAGFS